MLHFPLGAENKVTVGHAHVFDTVGRVYGSDIADRLLTGKRGSHQMMLQ